MSKNTFKAYIPSFKLRAASLETGVITVVPLTLAMTALIQGTYLLTY